jgi:hypothetical protein
MAVSVAATAALLLGAGASCAEADLGECAQPLTSGASATASDCLFILRAAIGTVTCSPACVCAPGGSLPVAATDALVCLKGATGQDVGFDCPCTGATTTTSSTLGSVTTTSVVTTTTIPGQPLFRFYDNACLDFTIRAPFHGGLHRIFQRGEVGLLFDFAAMGDVDDDGLEDVPVVITVFDFFSVHPDLGTIHVTSSSAVHPLEDRTPVGLLEERRNNFPGIFELPPNVFAGDADLTLEPWLMFTVTPNVENKLHYDVPLSLAGIVTADPIADGNVFELADSEVRTLIKPDDSRWFGATLEGLRLTPLTDTCR